MCCAAASVTGSPSCLRLSLVDWKVHRGDPGQAAVGSGVNVVAAQLEHHAMPAAASGFTATPCCCPTRSCPTDYARRSPSRRRCGTRRRSSSAYPRPYYRAVLGDARQLFSAGVPILNLTKGLEVGSLRRMTEILAELLPGSPAGVLSRPNLAKEVAAAGQPPDQNPHWCSAAKLVTVVGFGGTSRWNCSLIRL